MASKKPPKETLSFDYVEEEIPVSKIFEREVIRPKETKPVQPDDGVEIHDIVGPWKNSYIEDLLVQESRTVNQTKPDLMRPNETLSDPRAVSAKAPAPVEDLVDGYIDELMLEPGELYHEISKRLNPIEQSDPTRPNETLSDLMGPPIPTFAPEPKIPDLTRPNETFRNPVNPSINDIVVLDYLKSQGAGLFTYDEISAEVGRSYFGVKRTIERLMTLGFIERLSPKNTGRGGGVILSITPSGLAHWNLNHKLVGMAMRSK